MRRAMRALVAALALGLALTQAAPARAQDTKQDRRGPVTVTVTLLSPPAADAPLRVRVALDTHSVALDGIALDRVVTVRTAAGAELVASAVEQATGGGHHRQAVLVFPPAAGDVTVVVRDVGGVPERVLSWPRTR